MTIIISGFAGSGKSSLADSLGKSLGIKVVHASALLKEMKDAGEAALEKEVQKVHDWWESEQAKEFMQKRHQDPSLDLALDEKLLKIAKKGKVILDSWTMQYLYKGKAFRIWLNASAQVRAKRVSERDKLDYNVVLEKIKTRDEQTKALYQRLYNFTMGENLQVFDLALDTDKFSQKEVFEKVLKEIEAKKWKE